MTNIREIARLAVVSTATVSRVINDPPYVNEEKRRKVSEIIRQLDYLPNSSATSLKKGMAPIVGILRFRLAAVAIVFVYSALIASAISTHKSSACAA